MLNQSLKDLKLSKQVNTYLKVALVIQRIKEALLMLSLIFAMLNY